MTEQKNALTGSLTEMTATECLEIIGTTTVGVIAYVDAEGQQLIPVNFIVLDGLIYFRTVVDGLLAELSLGHDDVAFGAVHQDDASRSGWNVTARGSARGVEDRATINKVLSNPSLRPWAGGVRPAVIEVRPVSVAGRRVTDLSLAAPNPPGDSTWQ